MWQCKWRHLVVKFGTNTSGTTYWPNLEPMQVALFLATETIPWVRCASDILASGVVGIWHSGFGPDFEA